MDFALYVALEGGAPELVASFAEFWPCRAAGLRRLRMLDLARPGGQDAPQANYVRIDLCGEPVFEAHKDGGRIEVTLQAITLKELAWQTS